MRTFFLSYFLAAAIGALALFIWHSSLAAISLVIGSLLMMLNVATLNFAWGRILTKKQVALPVGVIVIKYPILGFIIYHVATTNVLSVPWFAAGFTLLLLSAVSVAIGSRQKPDSEER